MGMGEIEYVEKKQRTYNSPEYNKMYYNKRKDIIKENQKIRYNKKISLNKPINLNAQLE